MAVRTAFTSRHGGVSAGPFAARNLAIHVGDESDAVLANRRGLAVDLRASRVVFMQQVHGADVALVDEVSPTDVPGVDALVTDVAGVAIAVLVADCVPVVVAGSRAVAVVHAGRRGVEQSVVTRAVAQLRELDGGSLRAWLGPSICGRCYEVPAAMQADVAAVVPETRVTTARGTPGLDLRAGVLAQLDRADVTEVHVDAVCTAEDAAYFSYRRDGVTGRFAGAAIIDP